MRLLRRRCCQKAPERGGLSFVSFGEISDFKSLRRIFLPTRREKRKAAATSTLPATVAHAFRSGEGWTWAPVLRRCKHHHRRPFLEKSSHVTIFWFSWVSWAIGQSSHGL
jgi:hypothetical protein